MTLADIWLVYRRWLWLVFVCVLVTGAAGYAVAVGLPKVYQSTATVLVATGDAGPDAAVASVGLPGDRVVATYAELLKSHPVVEAAIAATGAPLSYAAASRQLDVIPRRDAQLIQVTARSTTPTEAADLANAVVQAAIAQTRAAQLELLQARRARLASLVDEYTADVATATQRAEDLRAQPADAARDADLRHAQADVAQALQSYTSASASLDAVNRATVRTGDTLSLLEPAVPANAPLLPRVAVNVALAALVGLLFGLGAAVLAERLDGRLLPPQLAASRLGVRLLGVLNDARVVEPVSAENLTGSDLAEGFRHLRTVLRPALGAAPASVLVTSAGPGEGKTTVAVGLALALAASGAHVVLVDANLDQPRLPNLFGVEPRLGLSALLTGELQPAGQALTATGIPRVWLIASRPSEPGVADLLASRRMRQVIADLAETVDLVLVDGPSLALSDALALSASVSHVMLVVDPSRTKVKQTRECAALIEHSRAALLGLVFNRVSRPRRNVSPARAFAGEPRADRIHTSVIADLPDADAASRSGS